MIDKLTSINPRVRTLLWVLVVIGMLCAIPLTIERVQIERSAKQVEFLLDHQDLVRVASFHAHPQSYLKEQYERIKEAGISSLAVFESNLIDLEAQRRIQLFSSYEASLLMEDVMPVDENFTYVLFTDERSHEAIRPIIEREFERRGIAVRPWSFEDIPGLVIEAAYHETVIYPMEPDPLTIEELREHGFRVAVRLSDNRPLTVQEAEELLERLSAQGVRWIVFAGPQVMGWGDGTEPQRLQGIAEAMKENNIGFAIIELMNRPQTGIAHLAYHTDYNVIRLHSISEAESFQSSSRLADRIALAVKDRNIRMIYLNIDAQRDLSRAVLKDSLENVLTSIEGENGAAARIVKAGYELGQAEPFVNQRMSMHRIFKLGTVVGGVALTALMAGLFLPPLLLPIFVIGLLGSAGLYVLNSSLLLQALALTAAISAPVLAAAYAMRRLQFEKEKFAAGQSAGVSRTAAIGQSIKVFLIASALSLVGAVYVFGLLNTITYMLVIEQFRGVSLLHLAPIALAGVYYLFYLDQANTLQTHLDKLKTLFMSNIKLGYVFLFGLFGAVIMYYLSRTGNAGQASAIEMMFRAALEDVLGIRPRIKEFLIGHPLFLLGLFVSIRFRFGIFLLIPAVIGQLSMVDTFAHIHTPLWISAVRVLYGLGFGIIIGIAAILLCEIAVRSWNKWVVPRRAS